MDSDETMYGPDVWETYTDLRDNSRCVNEIIDNEIEPKVLRYKDFRHREVKLRRVFDCITRPELKGHKPTKADIMRIRHADKQRFQPPELD